MYSKTNSNGKPNGKAKSLKYPRSDDTVGIADDFGDEFVTNADGMAEICDESEKASKQKKVSGIK